MKGGFKIARKKSSRKYQLTINNPAEKGYTHETIKIILEQFSLVYWCMCDEIGESGTYHTHIYFVAKNGVMFDTVKNRFCGAHIEECFGTHEDNYNYIRKIGERFESKKETNLESTFEEFGTLPTDRKCGNSLNAEIYEMIESGSSDYEILSTYPNAMKSLDTIRKCRQVINEEKNKTEYRILDVHYLWGKTRTGKTRYVMEKYGYDKVYRVTNYDHPFDGYKGEPVILFDEFRSSLKITEMLYYLDGYPVSLPCRYADKVALYTTVYFTTNIPIEKQYVNVQHEEPETYEAFLKRIQEIREIVKKPAPMESADDFEIID